MENLFKNSTWIVPKRTLMAYLNGKKVEDQTIWEINKYKDGYIFGTSYTTIDNVPTNKASFTGSITPLGDVLFLFESAESIVGSGKFSCDLGEFIMQMNTTSVSHWSYMIKVTKHDKLYHKLPGIGISVPEFINLF